MPDRALISGPRRAGSWPIPWEGRNSQIGVFLGYACAACRALLDARLYLPRSWVADRPVCGAGIEFATKPQLALQMIAAAVALDPRGPALVCDPAQIRTLGGSRQRDLINADLVVVAASWRLPS